MSGQQNVDNGTRLIAQDTEGARPGGARIAPPGGGSFETENLGELGELPAGFMPSDGETLARELAGLAPHDRRYVLTQLRPLMDFVNEDLKRGGKDRCHTRAEVAARHGIGSSTLGHREIRFRKKGVCGLLPPGRRAVYGRGEIPEPGTVPVSELLRRMATLMLAAAAELERSSQARH